MGVKPCFFNRKYKERNRNKSVVHPSEETSAVFRNPGSPRYWAQVQLASTGLQAALRVESSLQGHLRASAPSQESVGLPFPRFSRICLP